MVRRNAEADTQVHLSFHLFSSPSYFLCVFLFVACVNGTNAVIVVRWQVGSMGISGHPLFRCPVDLCSGHYFNLDVATQGIVRYFLIVSSCSICPVLEYACAALCIPHRICAYYLPGLRSFGTKNYGKTPDCRPYDLFICSSQSLYGLCPC